MTDTAPGVLDLRRRGITHRIIHPGHVTSVQEAAAACGVAPEQVVKTLVVRRGEGDHVLVLVPGDRSLSWPKLRTLLGVNRMTLPDADEALAATGYVRGTITPLGLDLPVVADERIVGREITISALREWMAHLGAAKSVAVSFIGKLKTTAQMVAIPLLLYHDPLFGLPIARVGEVLIWLAAALTLWSMGYYLRKAWPEIKNRAF